MLPCIIFALHREAAPFYKTISVRQRIAGAPCRAWSCNAAAEPVLVLETGMGADRSRAALHWLTAEFPTDQPKYIVSAGFAGGLEPAWHVGDILFATEVVDGCGGIWLTEIPDDTALLWRSGRLLTASHIVGAVSEKQQLGHQFKAAAVDMESAAVAEFCQTRGIPWGAVRVISDEVETELSSPVIEMISKGVGLGRVLGTTLRSPCVILELLRLARATRLAADRLARCLRKMLFDETRQTAQTKLPAS